MRKKGRYHKKQYSLYQITHKIPPGVGQVNKVEARRLPPVGCEQLYALRPLLKTDDWI